MTRRVMIVGGTGAVGARILGLLSNLRDVEFLVVGRDQRHVAQFVEEQQERSVLARAATVEAIPSLRPNIVIDASGPFRGRDYAIPTACATAGSFYLDIADDREFVTGISGLDTEARRAGVAILSGAGLLPGLSMAAAEITAERLQAVTTIRVFACFSGQQSHGHAAYASLLARAGLPFRTLQDGSWRARRAWQDLERVRVPHLGDRLMATHDSPELALLPARWPGLDTISIQSGAELGILQRGLACMAWVRRPASERAIAAVSPFAAEVARSFSHFGTARSGMRVVVEGRSDRRAVRRSWSIIADNGDGAYLAAAPAACLARAILCGRGPNPGARVPQLGMHDILAELRDRDVRIRMSDLDL